MTKETKQTKNQRWRRERNAKIRRDWKKGQSAKSLAHEYGGLSVRQIYRIVGAR